MNIGGGDPGPSLEGWGEYRRLILAELQRLERRADETIITLSEIKVEIATLKTRAGMWGAMWGVVASAVVSIITALIIWKITR